MKKIAVVAGLLTSALCHAQEREKEIQLRVGYGLGFYTTDLQYTYDDGAFHYNLTDSGGAATSHVPIELRYEFHPRFSAGLDMRFGKYIYDSDEDNTGKNNKISSFGLGIEGNLVSKPAFRWFGGITLHATALFMEEVRTAYTQSFDWRGAGARFYTGILWFIADGPVGLHFNLGRDIRNFDLKEYSNTSSVLDPTNISGKLNASGIDFNLGICARLKR